MPTQHFGGDLSLGARVHIGDRVRVRRESWVVVAVEPHEACTLYTLSAVGARVSPPTLRVLSPFDEVVPEQHHGPPKRVALRVWRRACRAAIATSGPAGHLRAATTAHMNLLAYQLEPALALLRGHGCRLLLADEVGLGKTVQAGLAAAELLAAGLARRLLVLTPSGLREQWKDECHARFGLQLTTLDHTSLRRMRTGLPPDVNPWSTEPCVITSIDYVKRPEILPLALAAPWDIVVVDEAHHLAAGSDRYAAAHALCKRASYVLLVTATPHNGDEDAFDRLCGVGHLDDTGPAIDRPERAPLLVFRRCRDEAGHDVARRVHLLRVRPTPAEQSMHAALADLTTAITLESAHRDRDVWLMLSVLHKRALSGPYALAASAARRLAALDGEDVPSERQLLLPLGDNEAGDPDDEAPPMWSAPALTDRARERGLTTTVVRAARAAVPHDSKLARLGRLLASIGEPVIVFTEYRDTLMHLYERVPQAAVVHGGLTARERRDALTEFAGRSRRAGRSVLLATDAAGEGLNLQSHARTIVNMELPWNPMRLEQRIGRVDRIGQTQRVHVFHLVSRDTGEDRLLGRLATRVARAASRVGASDPLRPRQPWNEDASALVVMGGRSPDDTGAVEASSRAAGSATPATPRGEREVLVRFAQDADAEQQRLLVARTLLQGRNGSDVSLAPAGGTAAGHRVLLARSTRRDTRLALRGQTLALYRATLTDGSGNLVATHVIATVGRPSSTALRNGLEPDDMAIASAQLVGMQLTSDAEHLAWLSNSRLVQQRLSRVLARRVRAIAGHVGLQPHLHQAGLFDRRAEHLIADDARARLDLDDNLHDRLRMAEALAHLTPGAPELLLLLTTSAAVET